MGQLRLLLRSLAADGSRLEKLQLMPFGRTHALTARVTRLTSADGDRALLVVAGETVDLAQPPKAPLSAPTFALPLLADAPPPSPPLSHALAAVPADVPALGDQAVANLLESTPAPAIEVPAEMEIAANVDAREKTPSDVGSVDNVPDDRVAKIAACDVMSTPLIKEQIESVSTEGTSAEVPAVANAEIEPRLEALYAISPASTPTLSARAAQIAARGEALLRFVWEIDQRGVLTYVSRDFLTALGAEAMPGEAEPMSAFAARVGMGGHEELASGLMSRHAWSGLRLQWPLTDGPEKLDVELSAAPSDDAGYRGFGLVRGVILAQEAVIADTSAAAPTSLDLPPDKNVSPESIDLNVNRASPDAVRAEVNNMATGNDSAIAPNDDTSSPRLTNVVSFPLAPGTSNERRLDPHESAALRTIARVLGGPIGLPRTSANGMDGLKLPSNQVTVRPQDEKSEQKEDPPSKTDLVPELPLVIVATSEADLAPPASDETASPQPRVIDAETQETVELLRQARLREAELRAILDTATDGIVILSGQGRILSLNRSAEALFGVESDDVASRPLIQLLAPSSQRMASDYLDGLARNGVASLLNDGREVLGLEKNGGQIPLFMTIGRISLAGANDKFCAVLRDMTPWITVEQSLKTAKLEAEDASRQKSEFLATMSHEVRTPLNAIIGFSEVMMEQRFGAIGNERYSGYIADIHKAGEHILGLVNDLLDLVKIEAGKIDLQFSAVKLGDIVQQTVATMQTQANRRSVILRCSVPKMPPIVADVRSLRQILFNLLSNAIKYTRSGGQVIVSTGLTDQGEVTIKVRDSGVGMSATDIEMALKPFGRITTIGSAHEEGTGLGLPLTKALAEANRASFHIESTPEVGTLVQITFPSTRVLAE